MKTKFLQVTLLSLLMTSGLSVASTTTDEDDDFARPLTIAEREAERVAALLVEYPGPVKPVNFDGAKTFYFRSIARDAMHTLHISDTATVGDVRDCLAKVLSVNRADLMLLLRGSDPRDNKEFHHYFGENGCVYRIAPPKKPTLIEPIEDKQNRLREIGSEMAKLDDAIKVLRPQLSGAPASASAAAAAAGGDQMVQHPVLKVLLDQMNALAAEQKRLGK